MEVGNTNAYITAPTSPNHYNRSNSMEFYYSAPTSPRRETGTRTSGNDDDDNTFEFETSKKFSNHLHFATSNDFESPMGDVNDDQEPRQKYRDRGDSLPSMAFADELFVNGLVMPLKLPPRLLCEGSDFSNSFSQKSPLSSPRTVCRIPFSRKSSWNDDFDPFMVALEKVREEKRGRNSHYRRSRSHSPFRAIPKESNDEIVPKGGNSPLMEPPSLTHSGPLDFKGSAYARWVRDQMREGLSPKTPRGFFFSQRVRPLKIEPDSPKGKPERNKCVNDEESKVQKLKGLLLRYASFGRDKQTKTTSETRKPSYFSRLSFKFRGNSNDHSKKMKPAADTKMAIVASNKPASLALCLGYGVDSPKMVKCT